MSDDVKGKGESFSNYYELPDYSRIITFPNFKSKLAKKLSIKLDNLTMKLSIEKGKGEKAHKNYMAYLEAEINLITSLLNDKEINDDV